MARRAGLLRNRLNERTLLSWVQTNESLSTADSSSPVIAVMQPAHALLANHCTVFQRACPASRRLLVQPEVGSVVVIIGNVLGEESLQMALIQRDHVVEQVAAATSDPTLGDPILPGRMVKNLKRFEKAGFRSHNFLAQLLSETSRACTRSEEHTSEL